MPIRFGLSPQLGDLLPEPSILGAESGHRRAVGVAGKPLLNLAGMFVDRLPTTSRLLGLSGHRPMLTRKDGSGVENPGGNR
jgi:hypothetical protein